MTIRIQTEDFDITKEINLLKQERSKQGKQDVGAIVTFTGTVRDMAKKDKASKTQISSMSLEHYPGMTEKELSDISEEANKRWPLLGTTIIHRIGELAPGDNIVLVITLSSHRHAAFEAADFLMDFLKSKAPFWKKEQPLEGDANWVDARDSDKQALSRWEKQN
ncbi:MAG: molybdenum cofactor biosynthesis protein MoaE [Rhodomicrobiaceae bacterium]